MTRTALPFFGLLLASSALAPLAFAQTTISDENTQTQRTSNTGDLTVGDTGILRPAAGGAIIVDSSNDVLIDRVVDENGGVTEGLIEIEDRDDVTGIDIQGGNSGDITVNGNIVITEDFSPGDADGDNIPDGDFAQGSGRTGILISGSSPFTGDVTAGANSGIQIEGRNSFAYRLLENAGLIGDLTAGGSVNVTGDNSAALSIEGDVDGNVLTAGSISVQGGGSNGVLISGDLTGGYENQAAIAVTGYRTGARPTPAARALLDADETRQAGSAVQISGSVDGGVFFRETVNSETGEVTARSSIIQNGSAPAILLDGEGTPISIGVVARITDMADPDFDPDLQYAFINQGDMQASGLFDDFDATVFEARDVTLDGGFSNTGVMTAETFRSGDDGTADADDATGTARVIVFGDNAVADAINNGGLISARVSEASDVIFADRDAIIPARALTAVAIDIQAAAQTAALSNSGTITAIITGREGEAVVIRDASGTLSTIDNTGIIAAIGGTSDAVNEVDTDFNLIAIDVRANTVGVTVTQDRVAGADLPSISGDVLFGSGDDVFDIDSGVVLGDVAFGDGADSLQIENSSFVGDVTDSDGMLALRVEDSTLALTGGRPIDITSASFDGESTFRPSINGRDGTASTLVASGDVTFEDGARIIPFIQSFPQNGLTRFTIAQGGSLAVDGDLATLGEGFAPFLFDTDYSIDAATNTLFVDLRVRDVGALGLDPAQSGALPAAISAFGANDDLAAAILNITDGDTFNTAFNQLLPEFGAAARQFVLANVDGAVGAVGSHLNTARLGQERPGGVWLQEFGYFADRDRAGLSEQYRGSGFGFTGGVDTALGPFHAVGLNLGFASTEIEDVIGADDPLDVVTVQGGAYAGLEVGGLGLEAYGGGGYNSFQSNRNIIIGDFTDNATGDWDGYHYNASLRAGYDIALGGKFWARPTVSLDYLSLTENAYTEDGTDGIALSLQKRTADTTAMTALLNFGAQFQGERTWIRPALRFGYRQEYTGDLLTVGQFRGLDTPFSIAANDFPDEGFIVGMSIGAGSEYSSLSFDLDSDIRDGFIRHTGRIVVRLLF